MPTSHDLLSISALKKIDISDIEDAISDARTEELRNDIERSERIADAIKTFIEKSPVVVQAMKEIALSLTPGKFSSQVDTDLKRSVIEIAELFNAKVEPTLERTEKIKNRIAFPNIAVYVILISLLWLFAFFALIIYANTYIGSEELTNLIVTVTILWVITIGLTVYLSKRCNW